MIRRQLSRVALVAIVTSAVGATTTATQAAPASTTKLEAAVTANGVLRHLQKLQNIAAAHPYLGQPTRASGTPGYRSSVDYVQRTMKSAGWNVRVQPFSFPFFATEAPPVLRQVSPTAADLSAQVAYMDFSASGDVTATLQAVDVIIPPTAAPSSTSGCETADFAGFTSGNVALIQRGTCDFAVKVANAAAAGASAVIIFNEGQPGRTEVLEGTLAGPVGGIPALGASFELGQTLYQQAAQGTVTVQVVAKTITETRTTYNVIAETKGGNPSNVVMAGAHLDSVITGPGINDNGSGSAALLEVARQMSKIGIQPTNKVRFAWWGAEESGLLGSQHYVDSLRPAAQRKIALYLNFDMVGSPNFARFVYDGDNSTGLGSTGPRGSKQIESLFNRYFDNRGLATKPTPFDGRSDYEAFVAVGIPSGGLFTGAEGIKTPAEAKLFGGVAGEAYDRCYHEACDTLSNISLKALNQMSDAIAFAVAHYAQSTRAINGGQSAKQSGLRSDSVTGGLDRLAA